MLGGLNTATTAETTNDLSPHASLEDYLAYAALHNPGLEASFNRWQAALEKIPQAKALPDPKLSYTYFIEEVETRVGPQEQKFGVSQLLPWFGTLRLRGGVAEETAHAARAQYDAAKLNLFYEVKKAYYDYHYLSRAISITEENIQLLKHLESVAQAKHRAGGPVAGVIKAQLELSKMDDQLRSLQDLKGPSAATLNAALNRPLDAELPWPQDVPFGELDVSETRALEAFREHNPQLRILDANAAREEQAVRLAKKDGYPHLRVGVDYIDTGEALMAGTPGSGDDPLIASVSVDLPIWRGSIRSKVKQAERQHHAALNEREHAENVLEAKLNMLLYQLRDANRKIDLFRDTLIPQGEQSLNVTEESYRAGHDDFLSLIDAQRLLLEFQLSYERALADREQRLAELEMLVGQDISKERSDEDN